MFWPRGSSQGPISNSEAELFRDLRRGSGAALATLYEIHGALIYRFSLRMCQDRSIAEEVTQDVFLVLLENSDRFDPERAALSTWLCGIARNLVWKQIEHQQHYTLFEAEDDSSEAESPDDDPGVAFSRCETIHAVQQGIDQLPLNLRVVVVLCELEEMKYEEAAAVLGVPIGTVRSRLHRAKHRLARLLGGSLVTSKKDAGS